MAQTSNTDFSTSAPTTEAALVLPDSPGTVSSSMIFDHTKPEFSFAAAQNQAPTGQGVKAGRLDKYIEPGESVPTLRIGDKVLLGIKDSASPLAAIGWVLSAGYSQAIDSNPKYGTNGRAYAQRLGAAAARSSSEGIFSDSIMASILHEDPRYYKMGNRSGIMKRAGYAASRVIITRTDGGRHTLNISYLSGNLAGAALTQAYYPSSGRGFDEVMKTYGGSIAGGALGFLSSEFLSDALELVHLKKNK